MGCEHRSIPDALAGSNSCPQSIIPVFLASRSAKVRATPTSTIAGTEAGWTPCQYATRRASCDKHLKQLKATCSRGRQPRRGVGGKAAKSFQWRSRRPAPRSNKGRPYCSGKGGNGHDRATQRASSRPTRGGRPVSSEGGGETQACDAARRVRDTHALLSVAATYEHLAESVERDVARGRLPDPTDTPKCGRGRQPHL